jgi:polar amino acid transport system substrate-binding protein
MRPGFTAVTAALVMFLLAGAGPVSAHQTLTLTTTSSIPPLLNPDGSGFLSELVRDALKRVGYDVAFSEVPAERALINANEGIDDGNLIRIAGLTSLYPNLHMVPEKLMDFAFMAFTRDLEFPIDGWESLKPHDVTIITGWKILEANVVGTRSLTKVKNPRQLFHLLAKDRADVAIFEKWQGLFLIKSLQLPTVTMLEPPLVTRAMFLYLHKRHADLIPLVARALKDVKAEGTYDRLFERHILGSVKP